MNHNRKRREAERKRRDAQSRVERQREHAARDGIEVDRSALGPGADLWNAPGFVRRGFYVDFPFTCMACGAEQVWTAARQKWWYEVAKGSLDSGAKLCRTCRREARENKGKGDPRHRAWRLRDRIRETLEPALSRRGWTRLDFVPCWGRFLAYLQDDAILTFRWDHSGPRSLPHLALEREDDRSREVLVRVLFNYGENTPNVQEAQLASFLEQCRRALALDVEV